MQNEVFKEKATCNYFVTYASSYRLCALHFEVHFQCLTMYFGSPWRDLKRLRSSSVTMECNKKKESRQTSGFGEYFAESKSEDSYTHPVSQDEMRHGHHFTVASIGQNESWVLNKKHASYTVSERTWCLAFTVLSLVFICSPANNLWLSMKAWNAENKTLK